MKYVYTYPHAKTLTHNSNIALSHPPLQMQSYLALCAILNSENFMYGSREKEENCKYKQYNGWHVSALRLLRIVFIVKVKKQDAGHSSRSLFTHNEYPKIGIISLHRDAIKQFIELQTERQELYRIKILISAKQMSSSYISVLHEIGSYLHTQYGYEEAEDTMYQKITPYIYNYLTIFKCTQYTCIIGNKYANY